MSHDGPVLGLETGRVRLVPYDARWPSMFEAEAGRINEVVTAAGLPGLEIEHMGSTAIPGLCAKPILDLLAGVPVGHRFGPYIEALVAAGYVHRGEQGIPGREFFRRGDPRAYHVHLATVGGTFWRDHLRFRDALRRDDALRDAYGRLKQQLAERFSTDREAYIEAKGPFVRAVLQLVEEPMSG